MEKETHITTTDHIQLSEASEQYETLLHAQPYDLSATGFYFRSLEEYSLS